MTRDELIEEIAKHACMRFVFVGREEMKHYVSFTLACADDERRNPGKPWRNWWHTPPEGYQTRRAA